MAVHLETKSTAFAFCWEEKKCDKPCSIRERRVLFCWRAMSEYDSRTPRYCDPCGYRRKWVDGEYTVEAFVEKYNRRSSPRRGKKVLVIDDDPHILYALEETVRHLGHECVSACDAEDEVIPVPHHASQPPRWSLPLDKSILSRLRLSTVARTNPATALDSLT